jgi:hypothetical protein
LFGEGGGGEQCRSRTEVEQDLRDAPFGGRQVIGVSGDPVGK